MAADFIDWPGSAGAKYRYWFVGDISPSGLKDQPGNYMFVRRANQGWLPVYIGIADNRRSHIPGHEVWEAAKRAGATHVMGHTHANAAQSAAEERDLIGYWNPPMNTHHRTDRKAG